MFVEWSMNFDQNLTKCEKEQEADVAHDILCYIIEFLCKLLASWQPQEVSKVLNNFLSTRCVASRHPCLTRPFSH